jgi:pseudouridine-5'-monophosphatase
MSNVSSISHVVFDLDGLLVDTETWCYKVLNDIIAKFNKKVEIQLQSKLISFDPLERTQSVIDHLKLPIDKEQLFKEWFKMCVARAGEIKIMPGVERLLKHLHQHNIPMAIATNGKHEEFLLKTNHLGHIFEEGKYFSHIVHGDDPSLSRLKPFPDIYQICMQRFSPIPASSEHVLVFEDSIRGVTSAISAGMVCVMVCEEQMIEDKSSITTTWLKSFNDLKLENFNLPPFKD